MQKLAVILPRSMVFIAPVTAPEATSGMIESLIISVWKPMSLRSCRYSITTWGMRP